MSQTVCAVREVRHRTTGTGVGDHSRGVRLRHVECGAQQQQRRDDAGHAAQQEPPAAGHGQIAPRLRHYLADAEQLLTMALPSCVASQLYLLRSIWCSAVLSLS
jgi:hypothetical protein